MHYHLDDCSEKTLYYHEKLHTFLAEYTRFSSDNLCSTGKESLLRFEAAYAFVATEEA